MRASYVIAGAILLALPIWAQDAAKNDAAANKGVQVSSNPGSEAEYKIGPQDVVRIDVWKEPDISRTIPVRPDGKISLPLLNDVQAAGLSSLQLANAIHDGLTKYLTSPQVTVTVTEINSRRVYVTGEVNRAGSMPLLPNMTALQAVSGAGGFTQFMSSEAETFLDKF